MFFTSEEEQESRELPEALGEQAPFDDVSVQIEPLHTPSMLSNPPLPQRHVVPGEAELWYQVKQSSALCNASFFPKMSLPVCPLSKPILSELQH